MKKNILFTAVFLMALVANAQFSVSTDGTPINDGDVFEYSDNTSPEASLKFTVQNEADETISMKIKVVNIENTDGEDMELCFGTTCLNSVSEGNTYPSNMVTINPGETQDGAGFDHFLNTAETTSDEVISYTFQFQQFDDQGNVVNTLDLIYNYSQNLGVNEFDKNSMNITLNSTQISNGQLQFESKTPVKAQVFNLLGKKVADRGFDRGTHSFNVSNFSSGIYLVRFENNQGQTKTQKIVIK